MALHIEPAWRVERSDWKMIKNRRGIIGVIIVVVIGLAILLALVGTSFFFVDKFISSLGGTNALIIGIVLLIVFLEWTSRLPSTILLTIWGWIRSVVGAVFGG